MNFIRDRELAHRFKNNTVSSRERFIYFFIFIILVTIPTLSFVINSLYESLNEWDIYIDIALLVITILGMIICYKTNKKGDDKEYIERYVCIGFPILIQTIILMVIITIFLFGVINFISQHITFISDDVKSEVTSKFYFIGEFSSSVIPMLYFYWRLNQSIKIASH